jgi:hypothetical protein
MEEITFLCPHLTYNFTVSARNTLSSGRHVYYKVWSKRAVSSQHHTLHNHSPSIQLSSWELPNLLALQKKWFKALFLLSVKITIFWYTCMTSCNFLDGSYLFVEICSFYLLLIWRQKKRFHPKQLHWSTKLYGVVSQKGHNFYAAARTLNLIVFS